MIENSRSYKSYRVQAQDSIDFIYLCCHAVPALNAYMKAVEQGQAQKIPDADYFKNRPDHNRLREIKTNYKKVLGNTLTLSIFSYFESFIFDLLKEILEFQESILGRDFLDFTSEKRTESFLLETIDQKAQKNIKKLRDKRKKHKKTSYDKATKELSKTSYQFPSQLFNVFGIRQVSSKLDNFTAKDIPMIIEVILGLKLSDDDKNTFDKIRIKRNNIAHGDSIEIELREAIKYTKFLRKLAAKIDLHVCKYFFVIESY